MRDFIVVALSIIAGALALAIGYVAYMVFGDYVWVIIGEILIALLVILAFLIIVQIFFKGK